MSRSKREELEQYADPDFAVPSNWTTTALTSVEAKRLAKNGMIACYAASVPRRLGTDASPYELGADKKLCKRIAYIYLGLWQRFTLTEHAPLPLEECTPDLIPPDGWKQLYVQAAAEEEIRQTGATVIWEDWWSEQKPKLEARRMVISTFALERDHLHWGYRVIVGLSDELRWIENKIANWHQRRVS